MNTAIRTIKAPTGHNLTVIRHKGHPCWIAQEVGAALGYSANGSRLTKKLTGEWSAETIEGVDYFKMEGEELAELKRTLEQLGPKSGPSRIDPRTPNLLLLTREGFYLACLKANKPIGVQLRRWLASEVLPGLERGEVVRVQPSRPPVARPVPRLMDRVAEARELRLNAMAAWRVGRMSPTEFSKVIRLNLTRLRPDLAVLIPAALRTLGIDPEIAAAASWGMVRVLAWLAASEDRLIVRLGAPHSDVPFRWADVEQGEGDLVVSMGVIFGALQGARGSYCLFEDWNTLGWTEWLDVSGPYVECVTTEDDGYPAHGVIIQRSVIDTYMPRRCLSAYLR